MVTNICQRVSSLVEGLNTSQKLILLGVASAAAGWWAGLPVALITSVTLGGFFAWDNGRIPSSPPPARSVSVVHPADDPFLDFDEKENLYAGVETALEYGRDKQTPLVGLAILDNSALLRDERTPFAGSVILDNSALLAAPTAKPVRVAWKDNSCFLHSALQVILNESVFLEDLPASIARRLVETQMFTKPIQEMLENPLLTEKQRNALIELSIALNQPLTKAKLFEVLAYLHQLEEVGFPEGTRPKIKSLLTLLELYELVSCAQTPNVTISGNQINDLRIGLHRVNPHQFPNPYGTDFGDPYEVLQTYADLIFNGSRHSQNCTTDRVLASHPQELCAIDVRGVQPNWGHFELNVPRGGSLTEFLGDHLSIEGSYSASYHSNIDPFTIVESRELSRGSKSKFQADGGITSAPFHKKSKFTVEETHIELEIAPELLMIKNASKQKIQVNERMGVWFKLDQTVGGMYQLSSVVTHVGGHCTATVQRPNDGLCYSCNDSARKYDQTTPENLQQIGEDSGYVFLFRKIKDL